MKRPDLDAIRKRCEDATPEPWAAVQYGEDAPAGVVQCRDAGDINIFDLVDGDDADCEFAAHARQDIPALLAYIAELEALSVPPVGGGSEWG